MALLRKSDFFNHKSDNVSEYIERVDQLFFTNNIDDAKKKLKIFLTVIWMILIAFIWNFKGTS